MNLASESLLWVRVLPPQPNMITYKVAFVFLDDKNQSNPNDQKYQLDYIMGNCVLPSGGWSFRLYPKLREFKFLIPDGPILQIGDEVDLLWGIRRFGQILVEDIIHDTD